MNHPKETLKGDLQKAKRDCPDHVHSDQMVLWTVRQESGPHERQSKALKTLKGGRPKGSSPLRSDGSHDGQAKGWTLREAAKDSRGRVGKQF